MKLQNIIHNRGCLVCNSGIPYIGILDESISIKDQNRIVAESVIALEIESEKFIDINGNIKRSVPAEITVVCPNCGVRNKFIHAITIEDN